MKLCLLFSRTNTGLVQNHGVFDSFDELHLAALKIMGPNAIIDLSDDPMNTEYRPAHVPLSGIYPVSAWIRVRTLNRLYNDEFALSPLPSA